MRYLLLLFLLVFLCSCQGKTLLQKQLSPKPMVKLNKKKDLPIIMGAERMDTLLSFLKGKQIGIVANASSRVGDKHLVDTLLKQGCSISKIFSPEHGFRGEADAGEKVKSSVDTQTGLPIVSLYGDNKKPTNEQLREIEVLVFDIQSVGVRFYTYISTLYYVMEAAAENSIPVLVLDRPNPNAGYVDGPVLDTAFRSFIGIVPIPVVYGMTIGELALMINGEKWLNNDAQCDLTVIPCLNYNHDKLYSLPIQPSPNLKSDLAIQLYPGLCFFEGTIVNAGRGTENPFTLFGHPLLKGKSGYNYSYVPQPNKGSKHPKLEGKQCYGLNLQTYKDSLAFRQLNLRWLIDAFHSMGANNSFFNRPEFFDLLAGTDRLRKQIISGQSIQEIRNSWQKELDEFKQKRKEYLIYN